MIAYPSFTYPSCMFLIQAFQCIVLTFAHLSLACEAHDELKPNNSNRIARESC